MIEVVLQFSSVLQLETALSMIGVFNQFMSVLGFYPGFFIGDRTGFATIPL